MEVIGPENHDLGQCIQAEKGRGGQNPSQLHLPEKRKSLDTTNFTYRIVVITHNELFIESF